MTVPLDDIYQIYAHSLFDSFYVMCAMSGFLQQNEGKSGISLRVK